MFEVRIPRFATALAAVCLLLAAATVVKAGPEDAALLEQVKLAASKGQNAQTAAQVSDYVDENQEAITAVLKGYTDYLKQVQGMAAVDDNGTPAQAPAAPASGPSPTPSNGAAAGGQAASSALVITGVQPSGPLRTSHLAGYPALPAGEPASAVTQATAAQLQYAAETQKTMQARKAYLMAHPEGYTY